MAIHIFSVMMYMYLRYSNMQADFGQEIEGIFAGVF